MKLRGNGFQEGPVAGGSIISETMAAGLLLGEPEALLLVRVLTSGSARVDRLERAPQLIGA